MKANGNGWALSGGVLLTAGQRFATLPLGGSCARTSYQVRFTLRSLAQKGFLAAILPAGDQQTSFYIDGAPEKGPFSGLCMIDRQSIEDSPGAARGRQINDAEPHDLEITVRLSARTAQIMATLDDHPLYEWSGPMTSLSLDTHWPSLPQPTLHLGASSADWVVSAVKVKRLDPGK